MCVCCLLKTDNDSSRQVIYLVNGNDWTWMGNGCVRRCRLMGNGGWTTSIGRVGRIENGGNLKLK